MNQTTTFKYSFANDYSELAHPDVLAAMSAVATKQFEGYGLDEFCDHARGLIFEKVKSKTADVHFVSGGTQANLIMVAAALLPHEAVVAAGSGHVSMHETGAIEATGHKVCTLPGKAGKICPEGIQEILDAHTDEHMVKPRLVYISQSSELGTVYTKAELIALAGFCHSHGLYLYIDGARLGAALNSPACDLAYQDLASLADAFYIGGTKNGAVFGEALVICREELKKDFRFHLKQRGALLAKGAAIGIQFSALLSNGLYDRLAQQANASGDKLAKGIKALGFELFCEAQTNQVFAILPADTVLQLHQLYDFLDWQPMGEQTVVRLVTSWATPESAVQQLLEDLARLS